MLTSIRSGPLGSGSQKSPQPVGDAGLSAQERRQYSEIPDSEIRHGSCVLDDHMPDNHTHTHSHRVALLLLYRNVAIVPKDAASRPPQCESHAAHDALMPCRYR